MAITILKIQGSDIYDITDVCSSVGRRSSESEISEELSFEIKGNHLSEGDKVSFREDGQEIFKGIVVSVDGDKDIKDITCFDFGWYLNKNEDTYQLNASCSDCIGRICRDHGVPVGNIVSMNTVYKKVKRGKLSELIKDIIEYHEKSTGVKHIWYMFKNKFYVEKQIQNPVKYITKVNNLPVDVMELLSDVKISSSIEDLYNAIKVTNQEDNSIKTLAYAEDKNSIAKYGRLQKLETVTKEEVKNSKNIASGQLKLLNKTSKQISVTLLGVSDCRANKILVIDNDIIGIKGKYIIKSCSHDYRKSIHLMDLSLEEL